MLEHLTAACLTTLTRLYTGGQIHWRTPPEPNRQTLYYANHTSHGDFVLLWASLPPALRQRTRAVAGADYWLHGRVRPFIIQDVFNAVLIRRERRSPEDNLLQPALQALATGDNLIFFPEGTRNLGDDLLLPFKGGLYHLAQANPDVALVPVWITNLNRAMPKGKVLPIPLICPLHFGDELPRIAGESKPDFLQRARDALLALGLEEHF